MIEKYSRKEAIKIVVFVVLTISTMLHVDIKGEFSFSLKSANSIEQVIPINPVENAYYNKKNREKGVKLKSKKTLSKLLTKRIRQTSCQIDINR